MANHTFQKRALDKLAAYAQNFSPLDYLSLRDMVNHIPVKQYKKGDLLIEQGENLNKCYFIIEGCARKFNIDEAGKEVTSEFFVENQTIAIFTTDAAGKSPFSVICCEDCILIVGNMETEADSYAQYPELAVLSRNMMEDSMGKMQAAYAAFIGLSPENRVKSMMEDPSGIFNRVPKHQIASFLGITPESLSRITRRLERSHLKAVD